MEQAERALHHRLEVMLNGLGAGVEDDVRVIIQNTAMPRPSAVLYMASAMLVTAGAACRPESDQEPQSR
ncbi:MAG: hypothetical protein R3B07_35690 [Polyangiaceae bacterium]